MRTLVHWNVLLLVCGVLVWTAGSEGRADSKKKPASVVERKDIDATLFAVFRKVINNGADLYNNGETDGCYRLYEGALITARPLLDHRAELQQAIDAALAAAARESRQYERAFVLRRAIDQLRATLKADVPPTVSKPAEKAPLPSEPKKIEPKKIEPKKVEPTKTEPKKEEPNKAEPKKDAPKTDEPKTSEKKVEKRGG